MKIKQQEQIKAFLDGGFGPDAARGLLAAVDSDAHGQYLLCMDIECPKSRGNILLFHGYIFFEKL